MYEGIGSFMSFKIPTMYPFNWMAILLGVEHQKLLLQKEETSVTH